MLWIFITSIIIGGTSDQPQDINLLVKNFHQEKRAMIEKIITLFVFVKTN
jgi:hypothetical protein